LLLVQPANVVENTGFSKINKKTCPDISS